MLEEINCLLETLSRKHLYDGVILLNWNTLNSLVHFLISNTFLKVGNQLYKQIVGIPMGTNAAPVIANLYCYSYEAEYVSRVEREKGRWAARTFHMTFRLIDDVLSVDNPLMAEALSKSYEEGGIYPSALMLNQTSDNNSSVEFIGLQIETLEDKFRLSIFDKRKSFPFLVRRYPLMSSLIPRSIPYGVFMGLLHRGYRICSGAKDFLLHALDVGNALILNGCTKNRLKQCFSSFLSNTVTKYRRYQKTWVKHEFCLKLGSNISQ